MVLFKPFLAADFISVSSQAAATILLLLLNAKIMDAVANELFNYKSTYLSAV